MKIKRIAIIIYLSKIDVNKISYCRKVESLLESIEPVDEVIYYNVVNNDTTIEINNYIKTLEEMINKHINKEYVIVLPSTLELTQDIRQVQVISSYIDRIASMKNMECWFVIHRLDNGTDFSRVYPFVGGYNHE